MSVAALTGSVAPAAAGAIYDFSIFLGEQHPFAATAPAAVQPAPTSTSIVNAQPVPQALPVDTSSVAQTADSGMFARFGERSDKNKGWGAISEIRGGVLNHDEGPFSRNKEDGNPDINAEILFVSPDVLEVIWSPRPHFGADINTGGDTSQLYAGLSWEWFLWRDLFAGFSLGGAIHDGKLSMGAHNPDKLDRKELGCRVLFRESVEIGWMVTPNHGVSLMLDHISNAARCDINEGLENMGIRYGYRF
ncbi:MAG: acyloxyacyl hydrolase [Rhodospirillales bacterium]